MHRDCVFRLISLFVPQKQVAYFPYKEGKIYELLSLYVKHG
jgi:hypothetical protein